MLVCVALFLLGPRWQGQPCSAVFVPGSLAADVMGRGADDLAAVALSSFENWFGSTFSSRILKESNVLGSVFSYKFSSFYCTFYLQSCGESLLFHGYSFNVCLTKVGWPSSAARHAFTWHSSEYVMRSVLLRPWFCVFGCRMYVLRIRFLYDVRFAW